MYRLDILEDAQRDLARLDKSVAKRISKRLEWLTDHFEQVKPESLTGEFARFFKFRVGDYRAIYKVIYEEQLIVVYHIRHRREVYR
ncbi:MAG: type II toxin-antitoxin system RelE/ParE family toxin [Chloroflexi bacterium]|nr:type II toxin-antitoxin system RelE/ParE family toxin [Chloroflexota bacterium]